MWDCNCNVVDSEYCYENATKTVPPSWSAWKKIGDCKPIKTCNLMGKQMKQRKCLYEDGNVEIETSSRSNETATLTVFVIL